MTGKVEYSPDFKSETSMKKLKAYEEIIEETIKGARKTMQAEIVAAIEKRREGLRNEGYPDIANGCNEAIEAAKSVKIR